MSPKSLFIYRLWANQILSLSFSFSLFLFIFLYVSILLYLVKDRKDIPLEGPLVWILLLYPYTVIQHASFSHDFPLYPYFQLHFKKINSGSISFQ